MSSPKLLFSSKIFNSNILSDPTGPNMSGEFPVIKSVHSLVAKHVTKEKWDKLNNIKTKTSGCTLKSCR